MLACAVTMHKQEQQRQYADSTEWPKKNPKVAQARPHRMSATVAERATLPPIVIRHLVLSLLAN